MGTVWTDYLWDHGDCLGAVVLDQDFRVRAATDSIVERGGYGRDELLSMTALDLVHPDDLERAATALTEAYDRDEERGEGMYRLYVNGRGYEPFGLEVRRLPAVDEAVVMRVNEATAELKAIELSEDMVRAVRVLAGPFSLDSALESVQRMAERQLPGVQMVVTVFGADGAPRTWFPPDRAPLPAGLLATNACAHPLALPAHVADAVSRFRRGEWLLHHRLGVIDASMPERVVFALMDDDDAVMGYVEAVRPWSTVPDNGEWLVYGSATQILQAALLRHRLDGALRFAADHDPLTGLLNRRGLFGRLRDCDECASGLLIVDLDDFSLVNNTLGHAAGDAALRSISERLLAACPPDAMVARMGGDEFVVVLPAGWTPDDVFGLADSIRGELVMSFGSGSSLREVGASIGAVAVEHGEPIERAINRADAAMYRAKRNGGDRVSAG